MFEQIVDSYNPEIIPASMFDFEKVKPAPGAEKLVYKIEHGGRDLAAKLFRRINQGSDERQDRQKGALTEFKAYRYLKTTPIGIYIPEAIAIITGPKNAAIGLAVEWRDG